jgi:hypothetical protein
VSTSAPAVDWDAILESEGLASLDSGTTVSQRGRPADPLWATPHGVKSLGPEEMDRRRVLLAEHDFRGSHMGPSSSVRPRRDRAIYGLHANGWTQRQIGRRYHMTTWAVRRAIQRVERAYALRKAEGPTREMLTRFAREADPGLVALVFLLLERTLEQPEAGREILRTARDIPELRGLLDG